MHNLSNIVKLFAFLQNMQATLADLLQSEVCLFQVQLMYHTNIFTKTKASTVLRVLVSCYSIENRWHWDLKNIRLVWWRTVKTWIKDNFYWKTQATRTLNLRRLNIPAFRQRRFLFGCNLLTIHVYLLHKHVLLYRLTFLLTTAKFGTSVSEVLIHFLTYDCAEKYLTTFWARQCPLQV
jgi:hypothetical protein